MQKHALSIASLLLLCCGHSVTANPNSEVEPPYTTSFRITKGKNAEEGQFPFQVSLQDTSGQLLCGGVIISVNFVVTAAYCVTDYWGYNKSALAIMVRAGSTKRDSGGVVVGVKKIIVHDLYRKPTQNDNDIALLRLNTPLTFDKNIKAIPLASSDPPTGAMVTISGWGLVCVGCPTATHLQYTTLCSISRSKCRRQRMYVPKSVLCLSYSTEKGACNGDFGGPAVYKNKLVGIAKYDMLSCGSSLPDGYTKVSSYLKWLRQHSDVR